MLAPPLSSLLTRLTEGEGGAAEKQSRRRLRETGRSVGSSVGLAAAEEPATERRAALNGTAVDESCHSAAPPSTFSRRINSDGERESFSKMTDSSMARMALRQPSRSITLRVIPCRTAGGGAGSDGAAVGAQQKGGGLCIVHCAQNGSCIILHRVGVECALCIVHSMGVNCALCAVHRRGLCIVCCVDCALCAAILLRSCLHIGVAGEPDCPVGAT